MASPIEYAWKRLAPGVFALRDPHRLDVDEFADSVLRELAAVARALDPAEGQAWIGLHQAVDEDRAGLDARGHALGPRAVAGPHRGAEAERGVVGQPHGV